jgi:hypothetical protein
MNTEATPLDLQAHVVAFRAKHDEELAMLNEVAAKLKADHGIELIVTPITKDADLFHTPHPKAEFKTFNSTALWLTVGDKLKVESGFDSRTFRKGAKGWNTKGIVAHLAALYQMGLEALLQQQQREEITRNNSQIAQRLTAEFRPLTPGIYVGYHGYHPNTVTLKYESWALSEEEARKVLTAFRAAGLLPPAITEPPPADVVRATPEVAPAKRPE